MQVTKQNIDRRAIVSWSGGKDGYYAALLAQGMGCFLAVALNMLNEEGSVSRAHGLPPALLQAQADTLGLPIIMIPSSWQDYEKKFANALHHLKTTYHATHVIFGDIDLQEHRDWEEMVCRKAGLIAEWPLWGRDRRELVADMLQIGIKTMIVSCNQLMGEHYLGKMLTSRLVAALTKENIDPCGENGEFHTMVIDGPLFKAPLCVSVVGRTLLNGYWIASLELQK